MYLTFNEYCVYTGSGTTGPIDSTAFLLYEAEAEAQIDWYTFNRIQNWETYPESVKLCMCKLIEFAYIASGLYAGVESSSDDGGKTIASQSNDGVSISYNVISASEAFASLTSKGKGNIIESTIRQYLNGLKDEKGRNVLYRGVYEDE